MDNKYLTVTALTQYIKHKFDMDDNLRMVFLKGEISNLKNHTSGHLYFSIKDENSKINAIMFSSNANKLKFKPFDGTKVLVFGRISIYEATGNYQIYIEEMIEDGVGNLYVAYEKLKNELEKEGLFANEHKKEIPKLPHKIGIITAPTGAAIKDIISTIKRRYNICETYLFPSLVQGDMAASDIVKNIELADKCDLDLIILGRGGGSIEDLWAFNEEIVARAIYKANTPIISAVGHEVDYTIADFVADLRAPTPTGAAELAVPNINDVINNLRQLSIRLNQSMIKKINYQKLLLDTFKNSFVLKNPMILYENRKQKVILYLEKLNILVKNKIKDANNNYLNIVSKLELLNPLHILDRGYSITLKDDKVIKSINDVKINDNLQIRLCDGNIFVTANKKEDNNERK